MSDTKMMRLSQVATQLNVGSSTLREHLASKGYVIENSPNAKITSEQFNMLSKEFASSIATKQEASGLTIGTKNQENIVISNQNQRDHKKKEEEEDSQIFIKNMSSEDNKTVKENPFKNRNQNRNQDARLVKPQLAGLKVVDKINLDELNKKNNVGKDFKLEKVSFVKDAPAVVGDEPTKRKRKRRRKKRKPAIDGQTQNPVVTDKNAEKTESSEKVVSPVITVELPKEPPMELIEAKADRLQGLTVLGKIELPDPRAKKKPQPVAKPVASSDDSKNKRNKRKRKRIRNGQSEGNGNTIANAVNANNNSNNNASSVNKDGVSTTPNPNPNVQQNNNNRERTNHSPNNNSRPDQRRNDGNNQNRRPYQQRTNNTNNQGSNQNRSTNTPNTNAPNTSTTTSTPNVSVHANSSNPNRNPNTPNKIPYGQQNRPPYRNNNTGGNNNNNPNNRRRPATSTTPEVKTEITDKEIQDKIKATLARLSGSKTTKQVINRRQNKKDKKAAYNRKQEAEAGEVNSKLLKVTEFISANDLSTLLGVSVNEVISKCLSFGMFISINERLDAEAITIIADEFGFEVEFTSAEHESEILLEQIDAPEDLVDRAPIVTIMGHVDHGKTSLLDYIRKTKVTEVEAGGITQHIGAYSVKTESGKQITFLDTPGHEAFTAMRARGAKVTDVAIIVIAADDSVMPQTKEAISHAQAAGVPIVIAINKIDKPQADSGRIKQQLSELNILVEDWGGKFQCQEISAKKGMGIDDLLEKVLLEAEILELKANPKKNAVGTVIEAQLDKGKGYVSTILVQGGTLKVGDILLAGAHYGKVKAMYDYVGKKLSVAPPSMPVQVLGLGGAPQAGDKFHVLNTEREAREIATKRSQILREQTIRTTVRPTLNDLGKRIALGSFKKLNIIVKGDVDGSVEALSDSLLKISTEEVEVHIIHKAVGPISESDVLLAATAEAIIIGFQVRPSVNAKKLAEREEVEIRLYSVIYAAIDEIKSAIEGMLAPTIEETIVGNVEVREVFKITKIGTVAGCMVTDGSIKRNSKIRLVRDGIVIYGSNRDNPAEISGLKRYKDDAAEVKFGFECGLSIINFHDMLVGDIIEVYELKEIKRKLA